ncbi:hypothetical protein HK100_008426 [Physocladia obscura]|uniref:tRNA-splicing endonuclease subunit Sen54 N-terminal domain-containing protein n=1 Tax=Physocladia obscura TaxID=109957 RepID=A0AAD5XMH3_9FUNG|nr:hypothetical protein HK100_008426 [Physocladia obscura]
MELSESESGSEPEAEDNDNDDALIAGVALPTTNNNSDSNADDDENDPLDSTFNAIHSSLASPRLFKPKATAIGIFNPASRLTHVPRPLGTLFTTTGFSAARLTIPSNQINAQLFSKSDTLLLPEEALFLVERNSLAIKHVDTAASLAVVAASFTSDELPVSTNPKFTDDVAVYANAVGSMSLQECYKVLLADEPRDDNQAHTLNTENANTNTCVYCSLEQYQAYAHLRRAGYIVFRYDSKNPNHLFQKRQRKNKIVEDDSDNEFTPRSTALASDAHGSQPQFFNSQWFLLVEKWILPLLLVLFKGGSKRFAQWRKGFVITIFYHS